MGPPLILLQGLTVPRLLRGPRSVRNRVLVPGEHCVNTCTRSGVLQCTYGRDLPATFPRDIWRICRRHVFVGALRGTCHARHCEEVPQCILVVESLRAALEECALRYRAQTLAESTLSENYFVTKLLRILRDSFLSFNVIQAIIRVSRRQIQWLSRPFKDLLRAHDCLREIRQSLFD
jgi:hypothetical protein